MLLPTPTVCVHVSCIDASSSCCTAIFEVQVHTPACHFACFQFFLVFDRPSFLVSFHLTTSSNLSAKDMVEGQVIVTWDMVNN